MASISKQPRGKYVNVPPELYWTVHFDVPPPPKHCFSSPHAFEILRREPRDPGDLHMHKANPIVSVRTTSQPTVGVWMHHD